MIRILSLLSIIVALGLTGCATASNTYLKNGRQGLSIDCSGEAMSWASCYEKADASCGYRL
ncbi:putative Lipoprotein [Pseudomonas savastanoi pv. nerii]|nr:putative Lipoprotein [Pseudomonas savastanoi pv. nerii]RMU48834.1 putative Lipoprotein [Pseudomonas savastanoi pv. nerii]